MMIGAEQCYRLLALTSERFRVQGVGFTEGAGGRHNWNGVLRQPVFIECKGHK